MSENFDREFWDRRWREVLEEHADQIAQRPPNASLSDVAGDLAPGRALDAGCGHGSETLWLAARGWRVTAVDFSPAALAYGRATAETFGPELSERIDWIEGDLGAWTSEPAAYDLVVSFYVHVAGPVDDMVRRLADAVAPGGTLLLVGHLPVDPTTGAESAAAGQTQVTVDAAVDALAADEWDLVVAEDRPRIAPPPGFDAVVHARRAP